MFAWLVEAEGASATLQKGSHRTCLVTSTDFLCMHLALAGLHLSIMIVVVIVETCLLAAVWHWDWSSSLDPVEEPLLHWVVVQRSIDVHWADAGEGDTPICQQLLSVKLALQLQRAQEQLQRTHEAVTEGSGAVSEGSGAITGG